MLRPIAGSADIDLLFKAAQNGDKGCLKASIVQRLVLLLSILNDVKVLYPAERWSGYLRMATTVPVPQIYSLRIPQKSSLA